MKKVKNNQLLKILAIIVMIFIILLTSSKICLAGGGAIDTDGVTINEPDDKSAITALGGIIIGFIQWVGSAISVIIIAVTGIKYLVASVEQKAEYKKTATYYLIGSLLLFGASNILSWIYDIFN